jgi:hypothetical protein
MNIRRRTNVNSAIHSATAADGVQERGATDAWQLHWMAIEGAETVAAGRFKFTTRNWRTTTKNLAKIDENLAGT